MRLSFPELTKEVNENKNFAKLRQVYNSLILAAWYKKKIKDSILSQVYSDKNKVAGVNIDDPQEKEKIYQQYLKAFKKGVYNYIKEEFDPVTQETIPRKYFSGGLVMNMAMLAVTHDRAALASLDEKGFSEVTADVASAATISRDPQDQYNKELRDIVGWGWEDLPESTKKLISTVGIAGLPEMAKAIGPSGKYFLQGLWAVASDINSQTS